MSNVRDLTNDPVEHFARRLAERVYIALGCASVPALQRVIADVLRKDGERHSLKLSHGKVVPTE